MTQIEKELGKTIVKISTDDFDAMEEVRLCSAYRHTAVPDGSISATDAQGGDEEVDRGTILFLVVPTLSCTALYNRPGVPARRPRRDASHLPTC